VFSLFSTRVPYKVVKAGEYLLSGRAKRVELMHELLKGGDFVMMLDGNNTIILDGETLLREISKCDALMSDILDLTGREIK